MTLFDRTYVDIYFHKYLPRFIYDRFVIAPLSIEDFLWISWNIKLSDFANSPLVLSLPVPCTASND